METYSFDYVEKEELIVVYRLTMLQYPDLREEEDWIYEGSLLRFNVHSRKLYSDAVDVIVNRNPKTALLYRRSDIKPLRWACYKVIDKEDFMVTHGERTDLEKLPNLNGLIFPL